MEKIYLIIFFFLSIFTLIFFEFILIIGTTILIIFLALFFALESNARDLKNINYFKNNQLFNLKNEINLVSRKNFISSIFLDKIIFLKNLKNSSQFFFDKKKNDDKSLNEIYTGDTKIDEQINDLINLVLRDYVFNWYSSLSSNHEFINELKLVIQKIIKLIVFRISKIDKINFITTKLVDNFVQHLKIFRLAKHHLKENKIELTNENLKEAFFKFEYENESKKFSRNKISEDENFFISFCSEIITILEYLILPNDLFKNRPLNNLINSILLKTIFLPVFQLITDPDFINQCLISLCKSRKANMSLSECFLIVLRSNANKEELLAVLESLKEEISLQRSKDAGGDDDFEIKQQLNSMYYVTSILKERLKILDQGYLTMIDSKSNFQEENNNSNNQVNKTELVNLAFDFVITNPLALTFFFEFMSKINKQCYLNFYLGVEGFRVSVEQKMIAIQMRENKELESLKKIYDFSDNNKNNFKSKMGNENISTVETNSDKSDLISSSEISDRDEKPNIYSSLEEIDEKLILFSSIDEQVRDEALLLYSTYLSPSSSKNNQLDIDKQLIQELKFKIENEELSETWFDTIHQLVYRKLREEKIFFESFKKSIHYYKLIKELGLLKDNSWKEKNSVIDPSLNNSQFYVDLDNDLSSLKSFKSGETDSSFSSVDQKLENNKLINQKSFKNNSSNKLEADIISTGITKEFGTSYGVYCIKVLKKDFTEINKFKESKWFVVRRYSDFYTFHQQTIKLFPKLNKLTLPSKKPFMSISQEFLEHRKHSLNLYLKNLLKIVNEDNKFFSENNSGFDENKLYDHLLNFFEEGNYIPKDRYNGIQIFAKTINSVLNPFKLSLKPAEKNKSNLLSGFKNLKPFGSSNIQTNISTNDYKNPDEYIPQNQFLKSSSSSSLNNVQSNQHSPNFKRSFRMKNENDPNSKSTKSTSLIEAETNIPLRILLLLMDEIFDLKSKSFWLRRRIFNVIKQIIQTTYGNTLNRKIIAFINRLFSPSSITEYIKTIKKTLWPKGYKAIPKDERTKSTKLRTKVATKMLLLSIVPDDLMHVVGGETSRKSLISLFNMLQISFLNKRLMIVILEKLLIELFPENNFDKIFEKLHSSSTKNEDNTSTDLIWPPFLNKMNIKSNLSSYSNTNSDQSSNKTSP